MSYIVPIHHASGVRHALKLNFLEPGVEVLVVASVLLLEAPQPRRYLTHIIVRQTDSISMSKARKDCRYYTLRMSSGTSLFSKVSALPPPKRTTSSSALIAINTLPVRGIRP